MPHDLTPATRAMRARLGALSRISAPDYDPHAATAPATAGFWAKLEAEVDPTGALPAGARRAKAKARWQANMLRGKLAKRGKAGRR
jgi:hypothetical protein